MFDGFSDLQPKGKMMSKIHKNLVEFNMQYSLV